MNKTMQIKRVMALLLVLAMILGPTQISVAAVTHTHTFSNGFCTYEDCSVTEDVCKITETNYGEYGLTEEYVDYYAIENAGQLYSFSSIINNGESTANCVLINDIVVNQGVLDEEGNLNSSATATFKKWEAIASGDVVFNGIFDGNNKTISGLYIDDVELQYSGLIEKAEGAVIKNVGVIDSYFYSEFNASAICGRGVNITIENCFNTSTVKVYFEKAGGIVGSANESHIVDCYNSGKIFSGTSILDRYPYYLQKPAYVGGICGNARKILFERCHNNGSIFTVNSCGGILGYASGSSVFDSYNTGYVEAMGASAGGISGSMEVDVSFVGRCYNEGKIKAKLVVGGICGTISSSDYTKLVMSNCYNIGDIEATEMNVGGLIGSLAYGTIENCHNVGKVTGLGEGGSLVGRISKNTLTVGCYYLEGSATDYEGNAKTGLGGTFGETPKKVSDAIGHSEAVSKERFASGEIAWIMSNYTGGSEASWGQNIDNGEPVSAYPVINGATVYKVDDSFGVDTYSNKNEVVVIPDDHDYDNGFCKDCGKYQRPYINADEFYEIDNAGKLYWFADLVNGKLEDVAQNTGANAKLTSDITVNASLYNEYGNLTEYIGSLKVWTPIGSSANTYTGTFDGQNYSVKGLYYDNVTVDYVGLFGYISGGAVKNVNMVGSHLEAKSYIGSICGYALNSTIYNCSNSANISGTTKFIGGIVGYGSNSLIKDCENTADITTTASYVGGIGGELWDNKLEMFIVNCVNSGDISGASNIGGIGGESSTGVDGCVNKGKIVSTSSNAGGIAGYASKNLFNSQNFGEVNGKQYVGGIAGYANCKATNCINTGSVSGTSQVGGVGGYQTNSTFRNCCNKGSVVNTGTATGGISGAASVGYLYDCYNQGTVNGGNNTGGVCGSMSKSIIQRCYNLEEVNGKLNVGGVCGQNDNSNIQSAYNHGAVTGTSSYIGGVCGYNTNKAIISYSYNIGNVTGFANVGSVCGCSSSGTFVSNCYYSENCAIDSLSVVQNGIGSSKGNTAEDVEGKTAVKSDDKFKNGEVAFLLNGKYDNVGLDWGQDIDNGKAVQAYPGFSGAPVYLSDNGVYTNSFEHTHSFENGFCKFRFCNEKEDFTLISETNYKDLGVGKEFIGYYAIKNAGNLYSFMELVNGTLSETAQNTSANAVLTDDIVVNQNVLSENGTLNDIFINYRHWTPIGNTDNQFNGIFDGNGYSISGLLMEKAHYMALFGYTYKNSVIKNLDLADTYFSGYGNVAGISAYNYMGIIENCRNFSYIYGTQKYVSGICAYNYRGVIDSCTNFYNLNINGNSTYVGTICGYNDGSVAKIINCSNEGNLTGGNTVVGGICGYNKYATIENCHNTGNISLSSSHYTNGDSVGGICGYNKYGTLNKVYNTGNISNDSYHTGGICGNNDKSTIVKSYNTGDISTYIYGGGICGFNSASTIENCYNTGTVTTTKKFSQDVGGICGKSASASKINNSFNYGSVISPTCGAGGIIGNDTDTACTNCFYLENCATDGAGTVQNGIGTATQGTNVADVEGATISVSAERFASGEIAYKLQCAQEINDETGKAEYVWGQKSNAEGSYPVLTEDHFYEVILAPDGEYMVAFKGDLNGDGVINETDYQSQVNLALSNEFADELEKTRADVNSDSVVDAIDVFLVERVANKQ